MHPEGGSIYEDPIARQAQAQLEYVLSDSDRLESNEFTPAQRGLALGFKGGPYDRWMEWMLFQSADGVVLPVVGMHMPSGSLKSAEMEGFYMVMTASYRVLLAVSPKPDTHRWWAPTGTARWTTRASPGVPCRR